MYITYSEYVSFGGTLQSAAFDIALRKAERKLNNYTMDRLKTATVILPEVKEWLTLAVDKIASAPVDGNISSYSNGIESFSYSDAQRNMLENELYDLAVEYLPVELISTYVGGFC